jgi:hypothetical protein
MFSFPDPSQVGNPGRSFTEVLKRVRQDEVLEPTGFSSVRYPGENVIGVGSNATSQRRVNPIHQATYVIRPIVQKEGLANSPAELLQGGLIFHTRGQKKALNDPNEYMYNRRITALGMPQFLFMINQEYQKDGVNIQRVPREIFRDNWCLTGVLLDNSPLQISSADAREAVLVTKGNMKVVNYWGPSVRQMDHLFLVLVEQLDVSRRPYVLNQSGSQTIANTKDWSLMFRAERSRSRCLSVEQLTYTSQWGNARMGHPIYIGCAIRAAKRRRQPSDDRFVSTRCMIDMVGQATAGYLDVAVNIR